MNNSIYINKIPLNGIKYKENKEIGCKNLSVKLKRIEEGGPFEWPNMVALNQAIEVFIRDAKKIVIIGSGTGTFEWNASKRFKIIQFTSSEFDKDCVQWCKKNRNHKNIEYTDLTINELLNKYGKFDLAITVDVIEHIKDYSSFLNAFKKLASRAVITTPNKDRDIISSLSPTPSYYQHVREWNAGEFFWVLKAFYKNVELFGMPDVYDTKIEHIGLMSTMTPLIAHCKL